MWRNRIQKLGSYCHICISKIFWIDWHVWYFRQPLHLTLFNKIQQMLIIPYDEIKKFRNSQDSSLFFIHHNLNMLFNRHYVTLRSILCYSTNYDKFVVFIFFMNFDSALLHNCTFVLSPPLSKLEFFTNFTFHNFMCKPPVILIWYNHWRPIL